MGSSVRALSGLVLAIALAGLAASLFVARATDADAAVSVIASLASAAFRDEPWPLLLRAVAALGAAALLASIVEQGVMRFWSSRATDEEALVHLKVREEIARTRERTAAWLNAVPSDVIQAFDTLVRGAIAVSASDMHFSPTTEALTITYRVDGSLYEVITLPPALGPRLTVRAKVLAHLETHVRNVPQDGRVVMDIKGERVEARLSSLPTDSGERIVLRFLRGSRKLPELGALGFDAEVYEQLTQLIVRSQGLLFVTGVVGSGKTTTMYAALREIVSRRGATTSVVTLEDPIELELPFATQTQINTRTGMTFATALRSALRQDPNVLMLGEIRDQETATIAAQAALTGHLLLTTVHSDTAAGPFARLIELQVEPFVLASATAASLSQRLVRSLCMICRRPHAPDRTTTEHFARLGFPVPAGEYYEPVGCDECDGSGFAGRLPITELLVVGPEVRQAIIDRKPTNEIHAIAVAHGMKPLLQRGLARALAGETSLAEVLRSVG